MSSSVTNAVFEARWARLMETEAVTFYTVRDSNETSLSLLLDA